MNIQVNFPGTLDVTDVSELTERNAASFFRQIEAALITNHCNEVIVDFAHVRVVDYLGIRTVCFLHELLHPWGSDGSQQYLTFENLRPDVMERFERDRVLELKGLRIR